MLASQRDAMAQKCAELESQLEAHRGSMREIDSALAKHGAPHGANTVERVERMAEEYERLRGQEKQRSPTTPITCGDVALRPVTDCREGLSYEGEHDGIHISVYRPDRGGGWTALAVQRVTGGTQSIASEHGQNTAQAAATSLEYQLEDLAKKLRSLGGDDA